MNCHQNWNKEVAKTENDEAEQDSPHHVAAFQGPYQVAIVVFQGEELL